MGLVSNMNELTSGSFLATILLGCMILSLYPIISAVRNIYFHPLSNFPGPKSWAATRIPYITSLLRGNLVTDQVKLHEKYGDVVRMGPDEISFTKKEAWNDIYVHRAGHQNPPKDPIWYKAPDEMPQNIVTTMDGVVHARFRKLLATSFTEKALRNQAPIIESYVDLLITRLQDLAQSDSNGAVVNMVDWMTYFTVDVIGDLALGESFDCLKESKLHEWVHTLNNFLKGMVYAAATRYYPAIETLMFKMLPKSVMDLQRKHSEFANERINRRISLEKDRPDFMTPFIQDNRNFQNMSLRETQSNFAILIVAGADTTATALSGTLLYLVQNPDPLNKTVDEIRTRFQNESDITMVTVNELPYLNAMINEALRLTNPVPGGLPRLVPEGGDTYAGVFIPGKVSISVRPYVMNRSAKYFHDPNAFIPERWLPKGQRPSKFDNDHLGVSNPFSVGHSNCLGKSLAWAEMRLSLARMLWAFDIEEGGKRLEWTSLKTLMIIQKQPVEIRVKVRKDAK